MLEPGRGVSTNLNSPVAVKVPSNVSNKFGLLPFNCTLYAIIILLILTHAEELIRLFQLSLTDEWPSFEVE